LTLYSIFLCVANKTGIKVSQEIYTEFERSMKEISIAKAETCKKESLTRTLNPTQLIKKFQKIFKEKKNPQLMRSIIGMLLCIDSLERSSTARFKRQSSVAGTSRSCTCPPDGILSESVLTICEFFECLDSGDVFSGVIFGFNKDDECLIFIVDTTGSMYDEIELTKRIILEFVKIEEHIGTYGCYILVPFNDLGASTNSKNIWIGMDVYLILTYFLQVLAP